MRKQVTIEYATASSTPTRRHGRILQVGKGKITVNASTPAKRIARIIKGRHPGQKLVGIKRLKKEIALT